MWLCPTEDAAGILRVRNEDGDWVTIPAITGSKGEKGDKGDPGEVTTAQLEQHTKDADIHVTAEDKAKWDASVDYVVEQGASGAWAYRKWNSGVAECWGQFQKPAAITTQLGTLYTSEAFSLDDYPAGLFSAGGRCQVSPNFGEIGFSVWRRQWSYPDTTNAGNFILVAATSITPSSAFVIDAYAIGRWK